jgi:release factor glutamine methyltransferase
VSPAVSGAVVRDVLAAATDSLTAAGCGTPGLDAEVLLADALGVDRAALVMEPERELHPEASRLMMEWVRRRAMREPVAYIVGRRGFRMIELEVDPRVLIPRPETELLVEVAAELAPEGSRVHDVGTGSGAVALALAAERPDLEVTASDVSPAAVEVARANAAALGSRVAVSVDDGVPDGGPWDLIVANLPYVTEAEWGTLQPEITRYEPREALVSGEDGLDAIHALVSGAGPGALVALEHAPSQAAAVRGLLDEAQTRRDLAGLERVTVGRA